MNKFANLSEMDKYLEKQRLPKLTLKITKIGTMIPNLAIQKLQVQIGSLMNSIKW